MSRTLRFSMLIIGTSVLLLGSAAPATAVPQRAPHLLVGTADRGSDGTFDFLATQSNSESTTWSPAFLTRSDGATGLFIPASLDLTFTSPEGSFSFTAAKGAHLWPGLLRDCGRAGAWVHADWHGDRQDHSDRLTRWRINAEILGRL